MVKEDYATIACQLREAYRSGQIPPISARVDPQDGAAAYAIQAINTRFWQGERRCIVGRKVGLTAKAVQAQLGVDQPDHGVLFDDMRLDDGAVLHADRVLQPKAEAEVAIVLATDITSEEATAQTVMDAAEYAVAAIEIVDSRIANWEIGFADTVADNGSSAFFVLGRQPKSLEGLDLFSCGMVLEVNDQVVSFGAGAACLGHPLNAAAWLAGTLARAGDPLRAGDIVLTGALGPMVTLNRGDRVRAVIGGLGQVSFHYAEMNP